ncbi:unnamed protein product [Chironomus riparius]|uniref:Uncharacterized protein n=1 Tax=Chironomus riparius TaxID=315576 RepID=A0A9N9WL09_9DIPT|nr:unnamed protein product [Chironomus riparius]
MEFMVKYDIFKVNTCISSSVANLQLEMEAFQHVRDQLQSLIKLSHQSSKLKLYTNHQLTFQTRICSKMKINRLN